MKIWVVNPFDPLPGEREQLGRYAHIAETLAGAGHDVLWWSSTFCHRFKNDVDPVLVEAGAREKGITIRLIPTLPYPKNISLHRLRSHKAYARSFRELTEDQPHPDVILVSSPPLELAYEAAKLGKAWNVPTIIDIQDQWPDNFVRVMPRAFRWLSGLLLRQQYATEREAYRLTTGIIGVAEGYVARGRQVGGGKVYEGVFPIGVSLRDVGDAMSEGAKLHGEKWQKPDGQIWLLYSGNHTVNYDFLTIIRAAILTKERFGDRARFIITGMGVLTERAKKLVRRHNLGNVTMAGFLEFPEWAHVLSQADVGFNAAFPGALIYFPNKIFYYLAAGAAVLNTIPGQCARLVDQERCGVNYDAGDPRSCSNAIAQLIESPERLRDMGAASRRLAENVFDRRIVYTDLTRFLEKVVAGY